jgi:hypothetical protein
MLEIGVVPKLEWTMSVIPIARKYNPAIKTKYLLKRLSFSISLYEFISDANFVVFFEIIIIDIFFNIP